MKESVTGGLFSSKTREGCMKRNKFYMLRGGMST